MPDYKITITTNRADTPAVTERLVRAKTQAQAIAHVVRDTLTVDRATIDDAIRLSASGVKLEVAD